jgi:hypothetical protein
LTGSQRFAITIEETEYRADSQPGVHDPEAKGARSAPSFITVKCATAVSVSHDPIGRRRRYRKRSLTVRARLPASERRGHHADMTGIGTWSSHGNCCMRPAWGAALLSHPTSISPAAASVSLSAGTQGSSHRPWLSARCAGPFRPSGIGRDRIAVGNAQRSRRGRRPCERSCCPRRHSSEHGARGGSRHASGPQPAAQRRCWRDPAQRRRPLRSP